MRSVCFVERLEFEFRGNLLNQALEIGDTDNDKANELVVGNIAGELSIFKGADPKPWRRCSDLGMITCVGVGDIFNKNKNYVICLNAEGWCYFFDVKPDGEKGETAANKNVTHPEKSLPVTYKTHLPPNSKVLLIADTDGDGRIELVVGYSDRTVRMFRCTEPVDGSTKCKIEMLEKWQLAGQIGSVTVNQNRDGSPTLMAAQPGCTFCTLVMRQDTLATKVALETDCKMKTSSGDDSDSRDTISVDSNYVDPSEPSLVYHPLAKSRTQNLNASTEIIGGVSRTAYLKQEDAGSKATFYALCTLDGNLKLVDEDNIVWSLQVHHQLFAISKLDVTGDGTDEVIVCSCDGQTYIVNYNRQVVRFQFEENVAAFSAGLYAVDGEKNVPCLIYATFNNKIYIYYNISMLQAPSSNLIKAMESNPETEKLLSMFNINSKDPRQVQKLYQWCLYGHHQPTT